VISQLLNTPVVITRNLPSSTTDAYGNEQPDTDETETFGELQQQQRSEPGSEGELSVTTWSLFLPAGTELRTSDTVEIDGATYQVTGDPWSVRNPRTGGVSHVEATVVRTAGGEEPAS
jgi:hypothetical protein